MKYKNYIKFKTLATSSWSKYTGVTWVKRTQKWLARINVNGIPKYLGHFASEEEAARKYDEKASTLGRPVNFTDNDNQTQAKKRK
tara:strand:- start:92 stop:346 length:255 start_codon:yes stop_codon:yes gene_type:complete